MSKPTPSPAPASGAACKCGPGMVVLHRHDCPYATVTAALPTPPSDAGTSERETGITMAPDALEPRFAPWPAAPLAPMGSNGFACCGGVTGHNAWCNGVSWHIPGYNTGSCWGVAQPDWNIVPAAPAAEGPRALYVQIRAITDDDLDSAARKMVDTLSQERRPDGAAGLLAEVRGRWWKLVSPYRAPAAALPGAERDALLMAKKREFDEADQKKLGEWVQANLQHHAGKSWSEGIAAEFAALTSEVRALREERDDWQESARIYVRSNRELRAQLRAARLASPSPTGAPSSPANPQEDETDAR